MTVHVFLYFDMYRLVQIGHGRAIFVGSLPPMSMSASIIEIDQYTPSKANACGVQNQVPNRYFVCGYVKTHDSQYIMAYNTKSHLV